MLAPEIINELDPGIRMAVIALNLAGFMTTDSGDGISKLAPGSKYMPEEIVPFPHIAFLCAQPDDEPRQHAMAALQILTRSEPWRKWSVEVSWSTADLSDGAWLYLASVSD